MLFEFGTFVKLSPAAQVNAKTHTCDIESSGKLKISPEQHWDFTAEDLKDLGEIGRGAYGSVSKMVHKPSNMIMAVKRIRSTVDEKEQKQLLMDLDVVMRSSDCPYIVQFYGALFREGDCWICMELMATSLDKFYKFVYGSLDDVIPEEILGKITLAVSLFRCSCLIHYISSGNFWFWFWFWSADCEGSKPLKRKLEDNPQR
uniref:mitogen-activated protein kinase kinase n=1 Tax=Poecilia reticulata TaxID=8081 RepID=A0A3P9PC66_POERE